MMQYKIKAYLKSAQYFAQRLSDISFLGQLAFGIIVLLISWSGVKAIQTNYNLQKQISSLQQQIAVQQLMNNNLQLQNQYYNSNQYLELSARQNFSLAAPGEKEIIVPKTVALANTVDSSQSAPPPAVASPRSKYQQNIDAWLQFFLHRQSTTTD